MALMTCFSISADMPLTDEKDLQGDKTKGADAYTGTYLPNMKILTAPSMCLAERGWSVAAGIRLDVTYELTVDSGRRPALLAK